MLQDVKEESEEESDEESEEEEEEEVKVKEEAKKKNGMHSTSLLAIDFDKFSSLVEYHDCFSLRYTL